MSTKINDRAEVPSRLNHTYHKAFLSTNPPRSSPSFLSTTKDQKALNIDSAKATLAQQFPAIVNGELGHGHDADILSTDASFL